MKVFWIVALCLAVSGPVLAQSADSEPPSRDDVILYLRTMRSHDMLQRTMEVQAASTQQLFHDMLVKENGSVPADFDTHFKKAMDDLIKGMPADEIVQAMIPAYQNHFTKAEIEAMNTFYSSPLGQKVLEELPAVIREGSQAAMPIMSKYLEDWKDRMQTEFEKMGKSPPKNGSAPATQK
jgi:hypothetical protein